MPHLDFAFKYFNIQCNLYWESDKSNVWERMIFQLGPWVCVRWYKLLHSDWFIPVCCILLDWLLSPIMHNPTYNPTWSRFVQSDCLNCSGHYMNERDNIGIWECTFISDLLFKQYIIKTIIWNFCHNKWMKIHFWENNGKTVFIFFIFYQISRMATVCK